MENNFERLTVEYLMEKYTPRELSLLALHCQKNNIQAFYEKDIPTIIEEQLKLIEIEKEKSRSTTPE